MIRSQAIRLLVTCALALTFLWGEAYSADAKGGASPPLILSVQGDKLSVKIEQVPLGIVLKELARQVPFTFSLKGPVVKEPVTITFNNLPLEEGIEKILRGRSYVLIFANNSSAPGAFGGSRIKKIIVLSNSVLSLRMAAEDKAMAPLNYKQAPLDELKRFAIDAENPEDRMAALEVFSYRGEDDEIQELLAKGLGDEDLQVRTAVLRLLKDTGEPPPWALLADLAGKDANPELRMRALLLLVHRDEEEYAVGPIIQALQDPDVRVRELAQELLEDY